MFFRRLTKTKSAPTAAPPVEAEARADTAGPVPAATAGLQPLSSADLRRTVEGRDLGFKTTADLEPASALVGQERAIQAIDFGLSMRARDFNIFVVGPPSADRNAAVRAHLAKIAAASQTPPDWVYVNNFADPRRPRALSLPAGRAQALAQGVRSALRELAATLPAAFASEDYRARLSAIEEAFRGGQEGALDALQMRAAQQNIAVLRTPRGFAMAPMHDGKVVRSEVFGQLPEPMRRDVETRITALQSELEAILASEPKADKRRRLERAGLGEEVARHAVEDALEPVSAAFADLAPVASFLAELETNLVANGALLATPDGDGAAARAGTDPAEDARFRRYLVNVLVSHADPTAGAPILDAANPTLTHLAGSIAPSPDAGADFLAIRPGALHRANGGALIIDARRVLAEPAAWAALKRALETGEIRIAAAEPAGQGPHPVPALEPEPIPLAIKIVLIMDSDLQQSIAETDPEFAQLFKVQADMDETLVRSTETDRAFARLIAALVATHGLKPVEADGVARLLEEAARIAEDRDKLSLDVGRIADILREADYWADGGAKVTTAADVVRALKERARRNDRLREHLQEQVARGVVLVDTAGTTVGQVNALSLVQKGHPGFGRPARITARVHVGQGRITDIEREVQLGGPLHAKGVMILWGYLAGRFAQDAPLALAATLVFEQSYEMIEGDSASAAELFALLSALADAPLRQEIAVTGSVNQLGEMQAVGGVNEKIEGFFDVCAARGLTGTQGVLIPDANRHSLMLREDVVAAVREGRFAVYAAKTVDEGIALLTGLAPGEKTPDGSFAAETVNGRVAARLKAFAERARAFTPIAASGAAKA
jgi:predicted ATP-dependent protease